MEAPFEGKVYVEEIKDGAVTGEAQQIGELEVACVCAYVCACVRVCGCACVFCVTARATEPFIKGEYLSTRDDGIATVKMAWKLADGQPAMAYTHQDNIVRVTVTLTRKP